MKVKTYKTYFLRSLSFDITGPNGNDIAILFQGGIQVDSTARFTTSNPYIQDKLEKSKRFNYDYFLETTTTIDEPGVEAPEKEDATVEKKEEKVITDVKDIKRFHNLVEMKNAMSELGIPVTQGMNYMAAKAAALKEGYDFQIQK